MNIESVNVRKIKVITIGLLFFLLCIPVFSIDNVFGTSQSWEEVTRFDRIGSWFGNTTAFTIYHNNWRIRWEYEMADPNLTAFFFDVKIQDTDVIIANYSNSGKLDITQGILNITGYEGDFYLFVGNNANSYSIIVEQDMESIPEFPSWIILPFFIVATLAVMIGKNKLRKKGLE